MTIPVQIAFQGGGARLALFFGVIKALQKLEAEEVIAVTRVSGASAGAIAAALFAGRANIDSLIQFHKTLDRTFVNSVFPPVSDFSGFNKWFKAGRTAFLNTTLGDEAGFAKLLSDSLAAADVTASTVGELNIDCLINTTNIINHESICAEKHHSLVQSLVNSAALPFIFRNSGENIDGGFLDNLPIDVLTSKNEIVPSRGNIVAIAFPGAPYSEQVNSAIDLGKRIFETLINDKVKRAKERLGPRNVLELPVEYDDLKVDTFSTDSYLLAATSNTITDNVFMRTKDWFREWQSAQEAQDFDHVVENKSDADELNSVQLKTLADSLYRNSSLRMKKTVLEVTAFSLGNDPSREDRIDFIDTFSVGEKPVYSYVTRMSISSGLPPGETHLSLSRGSGEFIDTRQFVVVGEPSGFFWTMALFCEALVDPGEEYTVHCKQSADSTMQSLIDKGADFLEIGVTQADMANVAEIRLFVPKGIKLNLLRGTNSLMDSFNIESAPFDNKRIPDNFLVDGYRVDEDANNSQNCPAGFHAYIWQCQNLKKGDYLRVVFTLANN